MGEFDGQVAVVTGAARGIGRAVALRLAAMGADIMIADRDLKGAAAFGETLTAPSVDAEVRALGRRSLAFEGDLGRSEAAEALMQRARTELGRLDILVNCAGGAVTPADVARATNSPDAEIAAMFAANYLSTVYCCRAAVPHMRALGRGSIINTASVAAAMPPSGGHLAHYAAAKAAIVNFTRSLAGEVGPDGIRVNVVAPGVTMTGRIMASRPDGIDTSAIPLRRAGKPDDIAKVVQFFASDLAGYVTGQCLAVSGGAPSVAS